MLTISVRHLPEPSGEKSRSVYECERYTVRQDALQETAKVELFGAGRTAPEPLVLSSGEMAYVMNDVGGTVDKITTRVPQAAKSA